MLSPFPHPAPRPASSPAPSPLLTAARSTFEALALVLAEPLAAPAAPDALGSDALAAQVNFAAADGAHGGALRVVVSCDVADVLAVNMLGVARADAALRRDAVGELANVVCGNVLPLVAGRDAVFHLAAPVAAPVAALADGLAVAADPAASAVWLDVEGGRALLTLVWGPCA